MLKLLFVDDDAFVLSAYQRMLHKSADQCHFLQWPQQIWTVPELENIDIVFIDQQMPAVTGTELLWQLQQRFPAIKRVLISGDVSLALQQKPADLLLHVTLAKPCSKTDLTNCIDSFR